MVDFVRFDSEGESSEDFEVSTLERLFRVSFGVEGHGEPFV